jgi:flagellar basal-body rod protein FlgF
MENAFLVGLSRQVALGRELEVISNNVANLNTTGYKSDGTLFEQFLMPTAKDQDFNGGDQRLRFVQDRATWLDMRSGPMQQTGNPLDVAIDGDGFLAVQTARGERYTRNGALQINATGELVTSEGDKVLGENGPIKFQNTDHDVVINPDGSIRVREGAESTSDSSRGKLRVVTFADAQKLQKDGGSTFKAPDGVAPQPATEATKIVQSTIEKSNVQGVLAMTRLIEVTRSYTETAAILEKHAQIRSTSIDKLADVPA